VGCNLPGEIQRNNGWLRGTRQLGQSPLFLFSLSLFSFFPLLFQFAETSTNSQALAEVQAVTVVRNEARRLPLMVCALCRDTSEKYAEAYSG